MYKSVTGVTASVATVATVVALPETGANPMVTIAIALAMGLATWAGVYFLMQRFDNQQQ